MLCILLNENVWGPYGSGYTQTITKPIHFTRVGPTVWSIRWLSNIMMLETKKYRARYRNKITLFTQQKYIVVPIDFGWIESIYILVHYVMGSIRMPLSHEILPLIIKGRFLFGSINILILLSKCQAIKLKKTHTKKTNQWMWSKIFILFINV